MREEGSVFLQENYSYKLRKDLRINSKAFECSYVEVENNNAKTIVPKLVYRPSSIDQKEVENHFKSSLSKWEISKKDTILAGDINIIYQILMQTKKNQNFVNLMFCFGMIPTINKPACVTTYTASAIDHIITNSLMHTGFKSGIIKTVVSDQFPVSFFNTKKEHAKKEFLCKRKLFDQSIETFQLRFRDIKKWSKVKHCRFTI